MGRATHRRAIHRVLDDFLFQSNYMPTRDRDWLSRLHIEAIVNCAAKDIPSKFKNDGIVYFEIEVDDCPEDSQILLEQLEGATEFIALQKQNNVKCLVHCLPGVSRSSTVTIAYLIRYEGMSLDVAFDTLVHARKVAKPNSGFWEILKEWEQKYYRPNLLTNNQ